MFPRHWMYAGLILLAGCWAATAQDLVAQYPRALLINFDPIIESHQNQRLHTVGGWSSPSSLTNGYMSDIQSSSYNLVNYRLVQTINADVFPIKEDGFRYTDETYLACLAAGSGWHQPDMSDYKAKARDYDLARKVDSGQIDEVFDHSAPYFGGYETRMLGRGGYWCNSPAQTRIACSKIFIISVFNYERDVGCMLEDYGHRAESILTHTYGSWGPYLTHAWNRFTLYEKIYPGEAACGNVHFAPNSQSDYDWGNLTYVWSYCQDWLENYPNLTGQKIRVNCTEWGNGDMRLHHIWWFSHMPHVAGDVTEYGMTRLNNWWEYMQNFNVHAESSGDHVPGGSPPPATPYTGPRRMLTANSYDDWWPRVNDSGRVVWYARSGLDYEIFSRNWDGSGLVQITNNSFDDEAPQINNSGRIVWQGFDGQDYEIFTANADGTGLVQITNNIYDDWHPQINDSGKIVWDGWDGQDYEIFSANADGTGLVQVTNNSVTFPAKPREDVWPQINNSGRVVWFGYDGSDWEIFSANADGTNLVNVSNNSREDEYPQINDAGRVVWQSYHDDTNAEIYSCNATGGTPVRLTSNSVEDWWPQINNSGQVVWMCRTGGDWEIMTVAATGGTPQAVTNNVTHDQYPQIDDQGRIVWQGFDGHDWEIYARLGATIYQITDNDYDDRWPVLGGTDGIVWHADSTPGANGRSSEIWASGTGTMDLTPPTLELVRATGPHEVRVVFSEPLDPNTAQNPDNYAIDAGVAVNTATLAADQKTVILGTTRLTPNVAYTLTVNNVTDLAGNAIAPDTQVQFSYVVYQRVTDGLTVLYDFEEGEGTIVHDVSEVGVPLDLTIQNPANVTWTDGGLSIDTETLVASSVAASKISEACMAANQVTIEAWIVPATAAQGGPGRIVTLSSNLSARNFTLGHGDSAGNVTDMLDVRLRTTQTSGNGLPSLTTPEGTASASLMHVVYTRDATGVAYIYKDAIQVASTTVGGNFAGWSTTFKFGLGNELLGSKPWFGEYRLVAIYARALTPAEVTQNFMAGPEPVPAFLVGDLNCDGVVSFKDINPFVQALSNPALYEATYPGCPFENRDINGDGLCDFGDINPFVQLLSGK